MNDENSLIYNNGGNQYPQEMVPSQPVSQPVSLVKPGRPYTPPHMQPQFEEIPPNFQQMQPQYGQQPYGQYDQMQQPYGQPYGQNQYEQMQPQYGQQPYAQPQYEQMPQYGQPQYSQPQFMQPQTMNPPMPMHPTQGAMGTKFCKFCASVIPMDAVVCTSCGRQVEQLNGSQMQQNPQVINIQNTNTNTNTPMNMNMAPPVQNYGKPKDKWVALLLCFFFGIWGAHKFYEGKIGLGVLYIFTAGLCGLGWLVDLIVLLTKPNPYYV